MPTRTNYRPLYAILLCFALPIVLAYALFFTQYAQHYHNPNGSLITPQIILESNNNTKTWLIAYLDDKKPVDKQRQEVISKRYQALGKDKHRVQLAALTNKNTRPQLWPTYTVSTSSYQTLAKLRDNNQAPCRYFIVDPQKQIVLCYAADISPKAIDLDMRKLLKHSAK